MPNRILKESICTSDTIDQLTGDEESFFYRLLVQCDDYGRMEARPSIIRSRLYPLRVDSINNDQVIKLLARLAEVELIIVYLADDKPYLQVATWDKHQQIRAKRSKYPEYDSNGNQMISYDNICKQLQAYVPVIQSNPIRIQSESNARGGKGTLSKNKPVKQKFGEFGNVFLSTEEHQKLTDRFGDKGRDERIERLSGYKKSKGTNYKDDYATILNWARRDNDNAQGSTGKPQDHDLRAGLGGPGAIIHRP